MKTINILGETQREQWHSVVNLLRQLGGDLTREGRSELCDELDRYIDAMEDLNESINAEKQPILCDRNGNTPRSAAKQEQLVKWAVRNSAEVYEAVCHSEWDDQGDIEEFKGLLSTHGLTEETALARYWEYDTLAREVFCDAIEQVRREREK